MLLKRAEKRLSLHTADYARLAAFRHALRAFMHFSEEAAAQAGLTSRHYQAMLILRASEDEAAVTINDLARDLLIKHNSAVGLVDRLVRKGYVRRRASRDDRRKVELGLTSQGRDMLAKLAAAHRAELKRIGPLLRRVIGNVARS